MGYRKLGITPPARRSKNPATQNAGRQKARRRRIDRQRHADGFSDSAAGREKRSVRESPAEGAVTAASAQDYTLDTDLYHVVFTNRGATVKSWTLKKFKDSAGKPLELVNQKGDEKVGYPFSLRSSATSSPVRT